MNKTYISLDLETTGFDSEKDQVIEIAAIKFKNGKIIDEFQTLINPETVIPAMVTHITGIDAKLIKNAPKFDEIAEKLTLFLGNYPIVGHNIDFDLTFLEAKGIPIINKQIDTLKLSSILIPDLPSQSLDTISRQLKIDHQNKHRAFSDAMVCVELLTLLKEKIQNISPSSKQKIIQLLENNEWELGELFMENLTAASPKADQTAKKDKIIQTEIESSLDFFKNQEPEIEDIIDLLGPNSLLQKVLPNYEYREGQQLLLNKIIEVFQEGKHLLAEAGTGTGKTLAYLLGAATLNKKHNKKVIISTFTNNLQDQIINKEFPLIQKLFPDLSISVLKGRKKYIDLYRLDDLLHKPFLEEHEITSLIKIIIWLDKTETGDLDELSLQNKEILIYDSICSQPKEYHHSFENNGKYRDFLSDARRKAELADILIVNHALLIQDNLLEGGFLPENEILIIDEAHHLENTVTNALTTTFSQNRLARYWDQLTDQLYKLKKELTSDEIIDLHKKCQELKSKSLSLADTICEKGKLLIEKYGTAATGYSYRLSIDRKVEEDLYWQQLLEQMQALIKITPELKLLSQDIKKILQESIETNDHPEFYYILDELNKYYQSLNALIQRADKQINWISKNYDESIHLSFAPLEVKDYIQDKMVSHYEFVLLTSATLSTYGNFQYISNEYGLDNNFEQIIIPSHFNYPEQVKIIIPEDLADPRDPSYLEECKPIITNVINKNGGKTLVLFTAKKDLARVFHDIAPSLKTDGIELLGQNISGGRGKILTHFSDEADKCAILGTNSFWEGVDLAGSILTCVIIQKLPFDPPDDPIIRARAGRYAKPFEQYALPRAILRFKQGFGRLIRTANDTGAVVILDSRLVRKSYGKEFIKSLPQNIAIHQCSQKEVPDFIQNMVQ